jgi:hypothetical protein
LHDLRHFMATQMLGHGIAVVTVAQRLGHARASTTLNVYGHCIPGADLDAARFISGLIAAQPASSDEQPHAAMPVDGGAPRRPDAVLPADIRTHGGQPMASLEITPPPASS